MTVMQTRRGTAAQWKSSNPVLANGELGFETNTRREKRGDGSTSWNNLNYLYEPADVFNVMDYGAKADNTTDDTAAIQACIDAAEAYILAASPAHARITIKFPAGRYVVAGGLTVDGDDIHFLGDAINATRLRRKTEGDVLSEVPLITVTGQAFSIDAMTLQNLATVYGSDASGQKTVCVRLDRPKGDGTWDNSVDAYFRGCMFDGFYTCLSIRGQGLTVQDCEFVRLWHGVDLDFPSAIMPSKPELQRCPENAFRAFRFEGIRIHSIHGSGGFVRNIGTYAVYLRSFLLSNVVADVGATLWRGVMSNAVISNFVIEQSDSSIPFVITDGSHDSVISNGKITGRLAGTSMTGDSYAMRSPFNVVSATGTITNLRFSDLHIENVRRHGFSFAGPVHGLYVSECSLKNVGFDGTLNRQFYLADNDTQAFLSNITLDIPTATTITAIGQLTGGSQTLIIGTNVRQINTGNVGLTGGFAGTLVMNGRAAQAPAAGYWDRGEVVWNHARTAYNAPLGWQCTASGNPGTWSAFYAGAGVGP